MGLGKTYWDRSNPNRDEENSSYVATLERYQKPLPPLDTQDTRDMPARHGRNNDQELDEFLEFFTSTRPDLAPPRAPQPRSTRDQSRLARATERVGRLATARPEVRVPRLPWRRQ